jgi:hypothetical protein
MTTSQATTRTLSASVSRTSSLSVRPHCGLYDYADAYPQEPESPLPAPYSFATYDVPQDVDLELEGGRRHVITRLVGSHPLWGHHLCVSPAPFSTYTDPLDTAGLWKKFKAVAHTADRAQLEHIKSPIHLPPSQPLAHQGPLDPRARRRGGITEHHLSPGGREEGGGGGLS